MPGYKAVVDELLVSNEIYGQHAPKAPIVDSSQWLEAHFKEVCVCGGGGGGLGGGG